MNPRGALLLVGTILHLAASGGWAQTPDFPPPSKPGIQQSFDEFLNQVNPIQRIRELMARRQLVEDLRRVPVLNSQELMLRT